MISPTSPKTNAIAWISFPSILIMIGFVWFDFLPSYRILQNRKQELSKRTANLNKLPISQDQIREQRNRVQIELAELAIRYEELELQLAGYRAQATQANPATNHAHSPANSVASALETLRSHNLECIDSGWVTGSRQREERLVTKQQKLLATKVPNTDEITSKDYQVRLTGRFQDIRAALVSLHENLAHVVPYSIEMETVDPLGEQRNWTLVIRIPSLARDAR